MGSNGFSRAWCFTSYDIEDVHRLRSVPHIAFVLAKEVGEHGKEHFQGYIRFEQKKRFAWFRNQFPQMHVEVRKGSEKQAWQYIADVEAYLRTEGSHSKAQGELLWDYGCSKEVEHREGADETEQVLDKLEARVPRWQIYREHRKFYFQKGRQIRDLDDEMASWHENGFDYKRKRDS